jgi:PAP2 superfamily
MDSEMLSLPHVLWHQLQLGDFVLALAIVLVLTAAACMAARFAGLQLFGRQTERVYKFSANIGILLALEQAYELARGQIPYNRDVAFLHSYRILGLEWRHGLFVEARVEQFFLKSGAVMNGVDVFYAVGHLAGTIGILVWLYTRRREYYGTIRNLFVMTTGLALSVFYVYPTAPPRMFANYGFSDPEQMQHLVQAGGSQLSSYMYNPYAAMPSLHVAYAVIVGAALVLAERKIVWRIAGVIYPAAMAVTVVASANHWILDVVGALLTVLLAWSLLAGSRAIWIIGMSWLGRAVTGYQDRRSALPLVVPE